MSSLTALAKYMAQINSSNLCSDVMNHVDVWTGTSRNQNAQQTRM